MKISRRHTQRRYLQNTFLTFLLTGLLIIPIRQTLAEEATESPTPELKSSKPLQLFLPKQEIPQSDQNPNLLETVKHPPRPVTRANGGSLIDELGRFRVRHQDDGETAVEYEFQRKSAAAKKADSLDHATTNKDDITEQHTQELESPRALLPRLK